MGGKKFGNWRGIVCVALLCTLLCTGCDQKEEDTRKETAAPTEQPVTNPEDTSTNLGVWTRAMGSVLIELNEGNAYVFGGYEKTEDNRDSAVKILKSSWEIESKETLLKKINTLLRTGDRAAFREEAREMNAMSKKKLKTAMKQLSGDMLVHYQMIQYNWKTWKKKGLLAWDMCRISHLAQWGYIADYLTLEEAQAVMEPAIKKCKSNFSSWDEVQNNWLDGYCLFATIDRKAANTDYTVRKNLYQELKGEQKEGNLLYDDQLFSQELKPLSGYSYQSIMKESLPTRKPAATPKAKSKSKKKEKKSISTTGTFGSKRKEQKSTSTPNTSESIGREQKNTSTTSTSENEGESR